MFKSKVALFVVGVLLFALSTTAVFAATDNQAPTIVDVNPKTMWANFPTTITIDFTDQGSGVVQCTISENSSVLWTSPTLTPSLNGSTNASLSFSPGVHTIQVECKDNANNLSVPLQLSFAANNDTQAPTTALTAPSSAVAGTNTTLSATVSDQETGVNYCTLKENGTEIWNSGTMSPIATGTLNINHQLLLTVIYMQLITFKLTENVLLSIAIN